MPVSRVLKKTTTRYTVCLWLLVFSAFILSGCETNPPEINQFFWQMNFSAGTAGDSFNECLSVFIAASDEEGTDDIEKMVVYSDVNQLYWEIPFAELEQKEKDGIKWYGTNGIVMPGYAAFPVGEYTVRIADYAGHIAERTLMLTASKNPDGPVSLPSISISGNQLTCLSVQEKPQLWIYSTADEIMEIAELAGTSFDLDMISNRGDAAYIRIYVYDKKLGVGIIRGDYYIQQSGTIF